jgi:hypothetical protein
VLPDVRAEFHEIEYGAVSSLPITAPLTRNSTSVTPTLSLAFAENVTVLVTVERLPGAVIDTVGAVVSGWTTLTTVAAVVDVLPDVSVVRIVIDALGDLKRCSIDTQRFADFIYALTQWFAVENVTCIMTSELSSLFEVSRISDEQISNMSDNLLLLGFTTGEEMQRTIRIIKTRGSGHDNKQYFLEIGATGALVRKAK